MGRTVRITAGCHREGEITVEFEWPDGKQLTTCPMCQQDTNYIEIETGVCPLCHEGLGELF